jgi:hypothetical protein
MASISEYISTYNDTTLSGVNYFFYVDGVNSSGSYDVIIFFNRNELSADNGVGLTTTRWNPITHEPLPPIVINITTYSGTANSLFVKNVAMHEFGHALGLNHASSPTTSDGPELMYFATHTGETVYPSTLDVYALSWLYKGNFGETVQLPNNISYRMLVDGNPPPPPSTTNLLDTIKRYVLIVALAIILGVAVLFAARAGMKKEKPVKRPSENEPHTPPEWRPASINTLQAGDVVKQINDVKINSGVGVTYLERYASPMTEISLKITRNNDMIDKTLTIEARNSTETSP